MIKYYITFLWITALMVLVVQYAWFGTKDFNLNKSSTISKSTPIPTPTYSSNFVSCTTVAKDSIRFLDGSYQCAVNVRGDINYLIEGSPGFCWTEKSHKTGNFGADAKGGTSLRLSTTLWGVQNGETVRAYILGKNGRQIECFPSLTVPSLFTPIPSPL